MARDEPKNKSGPVGAGIRTGAKHGENRKILPVCPFIISRQDGNMKGVRCFGDQ